MTETPTRIEFPEPLYWRVRLYEEGDAHVEATLPSLDDWLEDWLNDTPTARYRRGYDRIDWSK